MAKIPSYSWPWDNASASDLDRQSNSAEVREHFTRQNGVDHAVYLPNSDYCQVVPLGGFTVRILHGMGVIRGCDFEVDKENKVGIDITLDPAATLPYIARIIEYQSIQERDCFTAELIGEPASTPIAPTLTRTADIYEIALADILITPGMTQITAANITDLRANPELCGFIMPTWGRINEETLYQQQLAVLEQVRDKYEELVLNPPGGFMSNEVYDPNLEGVDITNQLYTHTALSTLTGTGANGYFKSEFTGTVTSISIGSTTYAVKNGVSTSINLVSDVVYSFILVDNTINFAGSGGGRTLLWENASPSSTFSTQTISLNLSNYDFVDVEYTLIFTGGRQYTSTKRCNIVDSASSVGYILDGMSANDVDLQMYLISRHCKPLATGVVFNNAISVLFRSGGAGYTTPIISNGLSVPSKIYGGNY